MYNDLTTAHFFKATRTIIRALVLVSAVLLAACGSDGKDGEPGAPAGIDIANAAEINAVIDSAGVGSPVTVNFTLTDGNSNPVKNLPASAISFKLAKLVPGTDGNTSAWHSYINKIEQPGVGPGTQPATQATTESGSAGTLVDNNDGTYTYTFSFDINNVTDPIPVDYVDTLTHRVTFEIRGFAPVKNPSYDWRPSDNSVTNLFSREIVKTETCNVCHENLALHGGARFELKDCVTCHNPGSADANSGNTVDMTVMTHKIHHGENLPSVQAGGDYCIYGFNDTPHCYNDVVHPQDIRNCQNCHDENDPETPDASRWYTQPSAAACGACHDDVNFSSGENHGPGIPVNPPEDSGQCIQCHASNPDSAIEVRQAHRMLTVEQTENYRFDILNIAFTPPGGSPSTPIVTFAVSNPQLGGPDDQTTRYDLENNADLSSSSLNLRLAWDTIDYSNNGGGTNNAQPQNAAVYAGGVLQATPNGNLTYDLAVGAVPDGITGSGVIIFDGGVNTADGRAPVTAAFSYFGITDDPTNPEPRRSSVDMERCNDCHALTTTHGSNRNNAIEDCQVCHNANAARGGGGPMDMKHFLHRKHAVDEIRYPQRTSNCLACHTDDGFYPVTSDSGVLASSVNRVDPDNPAPGPAPQADATNNNRISPNATACGVCHQSADAEVHMVQNGSSFDACQETDGTLLGRINYCGTGGDKTGALVVESCSVCHGAGRSADVAHAHRLAL